MSVNNSHEINHLIGTKIDRCYSGHVGTISFIGLLRVNFFGVTTKSCRGDTIFGIPSGWSWLIWVQFGVVINAESVFWVETTQAGGISGFE